MIPDSKKFRSKLEELERELSDPEVLSNQKKLLEISREHSRVKELVGIYDQYEKIKKELSDTTEML